MRIIWHTILSSVEYFYIFRLEIATKHHKEKRNKTGEVWFGRNNFYVVLGMRIRCKLHFLDEMLISLVM
jgi:hypothetical protein